MNRDLISKLFLCMLTTFALAVIGIFSSAVASLIGGRTFYGYFTGAIFAVIALYLWFKVFNILKPKLVNISFLVLISACFAVLIGFNAYTKHEDSLPTINEQFTALDQYRPFIKDTKAVKLNEKASLEINKDLPKLDGATALYPLYSAFAQAVYPENNYEIYESQVMCSTTEKAYERLIAGETDIIFAAKPSKEQLELAKSRGVELKLTPIGKEAFVFFVNSKNSIEGLTTKQIQDIYSGTITSWKEVGGHKGEIRAFQRPKNSGSQTMLEKLMEGRRLMTPPKRDVVATMGGIIDKTANYKNFSNALGYSFLFYATEMVKNNEIKLLKIDGVSPNKENISNKTYPLTAEFYAVTASSKNPNIKAFIDWILTEQGQYLVEKTGYTPVASYPLGK
jgi:phosphate transport system substrate-binding protein